MRTTICQKHVGYKKLKRKYKSTRVQEYKRKDEKQKRGSIKSKKVHQVYKAKENNNDQGVMNNGK